MPQQSKPNPHTLTMQTSRPLLHCSIAPLLWTLAIMISCIPCNAQTPDPWTRSLQDNHGYAQWPATVGMAYRIERLAGDRVWQPLPGIYYGLSQQLSEFIHQAPDEPALSAPNFVPPPRPPARTPQELPASSPSHTTPTPAQGIEGILVQEGLVHVDGSYRDLEVPILLQIRNWGADAAANVQVNLPLDFPFQDLLGGASAGTTLSVSGPEILSGALTANPNYNGTTDKRLLTGTDTLGNGTTDRLASLRLTLHFHFTSGFSIPNTPRFLYGVVSTRTAGANNGPSSWSATDGKPVLAGLGLSAYEPTQNRYQWPNLGNANAGGVTPVYFYQNAEIFRRTYMVAAFNDGSVRVTWFSPAEQRMVGFFYYGPGLMNMVKPGGGFYSGFANLSVYCPGSGFGYSPPYELPEGLPIMGCPTRVTLEMLAFGYNQAAPTTSAQFDDVPPGEQQAKDWFFAKRLELRARLVAQATPPSVPNPANLLNTDRDFTSSRQYFRVRRCRIDSDCDGLFDDEQAVLDPNWGSWWKWDQAWNTGGTGVPEAYKLYRQSTSPNRTVIINEFCANNTGHLKDPNPFPASNDSPDWIELYNISDADINLTGYTLKDNSSKTYTFLAGSPISHLLKKGEFMVVLCTGQDFQDSAIPPTPMADTAQFHRARFGLNNANAENLLLKNSAGVIVDELNYGGHNLNQFEGVSFGSYLDRFHAEAAVPLAWGYLEFPTPGARNSEGYDAVSSSSSSRELTLSVCGRVNGTTDEVALQPGVYSRQNYTYLTLNGVGGSIPEATIYYTTNGADPTSWSAVYDSAHPPVFDRSVTLKAVAVAPGRLPSRIAQASYIFKESVLGAAAGDPPPLPGHAPLAPQSRPPTYPEQSMRFAVDLGSSVKLYPDGVPMPYGVTTAGSVLSQNRAALMTQLSALPSLSLTVPVQDFFDRDTGGIYADSNNSASTGIDPKGNGWERVANMQWLFPNNEPPEFASLKSERCVLSMSGNTNLSWYRTQKHSLTVTFRREVGVAKYKPNFRPFADDARTPATFGDAGTDDPKYDSLILRNPTFDTWSMTDSQPDAKPQNATYAKDAYARNTLATLGHPQLYYRWIHLYINGLYWGAHLLSEKADDDTCERRFGSGNYYVWKDAAGDVVGADVAVPPATLKPSEVWADLLARGDAVLAKAGATPAQDATAEYAAVESIMDVEGFIDYVLLHVYLGNFDSLTNNGRVFRNMNGGKFQWLAYDVEVGADSINQNRDCFQSWWPATWSATPPKSEARLLYALSKHPKFAQRFGDRAWKLCFMPPALQTRAEDGLLTGTGPSGKAQALFQEAADEFEPFRLCESLRWGAGYNGIFAAAPRVTIGTPYAIGTDPLGPAGGFFNARRTTAQNQLQARGLLANMTTKPMSTVTQAADTNTWIITAPSTSGSETYFNQNGAVIEPDGPNTSAVGTLLAPGQTATLTAPFHLIARTRIPLPAGTTDDTPYWSNLLDVQLPTHP